MTDYLILGYGTEDWASTLDEALTKAQALTAAGAKKVEVYESIDWKQCLLPEERLSLKAAA